MALQVLQWPVSYVGDAEASPPSPARGSSDKDVLEHAKRVNQVIVTSNLDMILLCAQQGQRVVWIDPRGRHMKREELAVVVLKGISSWVKDLDDADSPVCLRVMRTKTEKIKSGDADRMVRSRMSLISAARTRARPATELGPLA